MPILDNPRHELFAQAVACEGLNAREAYQKAGYSANDNASRVNGAKLLLNIAVAARIRELQEQSSNRAVAAVAFERYVRIEKLEKMAKELEQVIAERACDPEVQDIAGGSTGHIWFTWKAAGRELCKEYGVDYQMLKELRAIYQQIAQEMGEWLTKSAVEIRDMPVVDIPEDASIDDIRKAKTKMQEALDGLLKKVA